MPNNVLTASRQNCFAVCPRKHYWQFEIGLASESESLALFIGSAWHRAMDARWQGASFENAFMAAWLEGTTSDEVTANKLAALLKAYYEFYGESEREGVTMLTEVQFKHPLKGIKGFTTEGKIDRMGQRKDETQVQVEYKTTGDSIQPDSLYWLRLRFNTQILQYFLAARKLGWNIQEVIYDVVRKPSIAPKEICDLDEQGRKIVCDSQGNRIFNTKGKNANEPRQTADKEKGWTVRCHVETPEEFGLRLYNDVLSRPDFYFARREVPILEDDLRDFEAQRLTVAKTILHHRKLESKNARPEWAWPRHVEERNCQSCQFKSFCLQNLNIDPQQPPQGFAVKPFNPELQPEETAL